MTDIFTILTFAAPEQKNPSRTLRQARPGRVCKSCLRIAYKPSNRFFRAVYSPSVITPCSNKVCKLRSCAETSTVRTGEAGEAGAACGIGAAGAVGATTTVGASAYGETGTASAVGAVG